MLKIITLYTLLGKERWNITYVNIFWDNKNKNILSTYNIIRIKLITIIIINFNSVFYH